MKPIGMLLLVLVLIAATAQPVISQEAPASQAEAQPSALPQTAEQPGAQFQVQPECPAVMPATPVCVPVVTEPAPPPCREPLPEYADYPLYWAGAVLYPVGVVLENIFVRPLLSVFNHRFEEPWATSKADYTVNVPSPSCDNGTQVGACPSTTCPVTQQESTSPKYNFQPHR